MVTAYIGIGSNMGNRQKNIEDALGYLRITEGINVIRVSSLYETEPEGGPPQGKFINGVIKIDTELAPRELLRALHSIEERIGRVRTIPNGPRTIDLDILTYGAETIDEDGLKIPHPRMGMRGFVLKPLMEIMCE